jgi:parallel beta-helix repeat protein
MLIRSAFGLVIATAICQPAWGATLCVNPKTPLSCFATIGAAVSAAAAGDTIKVSSGTYKEDVVITKTLFLIGADEGTTIIDATGKANGIFVNGMSAAPNPGIAEVGISGFTVKNANFEGILVANATTTTIWGNHVTTNNKSLVISSTLDCPGLPMFETNEDDDCGEGIHLMGVDHSTVADNQVDQNSGGILLTDETGPNHDNIISGNTVVNNPYDCGITLASHGRSPSLPMGLPFGLYHNTISKNQSSNNGALVPGAGAGVGIFAPFPGTTNSGNVVVGNTLTYNGLPGVTMHNHAASPMAPPVNMNDNMIIGNTITRNGTDTLDAATPGPTGINIFSVAPITGTVISQNTIGQEAVDVAFSGPGSLDVHLNDFDDNGIGVDNLGTAGTINATQNWWNCVAGPGTFGCVTVAGTGVTSTAWLIRPF